ncbi:MAG: hypothetical protein IPJ04_07855 [Candidatus Eisenbacteria bacterium]|nr:hypothetical protein [Candidatus Eisenbacteria bacterium]
MMRTFAAAVLLVAVAPVAALAAPMNAKVAVIDKPHVCLVVSAKPEAWMKKGANIRVFGGKAKIVNIVGDTLCVTSPNSAKAKVGTTVTLEKPRPNAAGC